jgi:hypothetical protein
MSAFRRSGSRTLQASGEWGVSPTCRPEGRPTELLSFYLELELNGRGRMTRVGCVTRTMVRTAHPT